VRRARTWGEQGRQGLRRADVRVRGAMRLQGEAGTRVGQARLARAEASEQDACAMSRAQW
jgi:hypothetical protein